MRPGSYHPSTPEPAGQYQYGKLGWDLVVLRTRLAAASERLDDASERVRQIDFTLERLEREFGQLVAQPTTPNRPNRPATPPAEPDAPVPHQDHLSLEQKRARIKRALDVCTEIATQIAAAGNLEADEPLPAALRVSERYLSALARVGKERMAADVAGTGAYTPGDPPSDAERELQEVRPQITGALELLVKQIAEVTP